MQRAKSIVLATPHARYEQLRQQLEAWLGTEISCIAEPEALTQRVLREASPRYVFFPHWPWRIPREIHEQFECIIFHMTDVPFGRGGSPLQNLISRGIYETKLTALRCVEDLDAGPFYLKRSLSLHGTAEEILMRASSLMNEMIREIVEREPLPQPQVGEPTIFKRRKPADGDLAGLSELEKLFDYIRMLDGEGYPQAFLETEHFRLEFSRASSTRT